MAGEQLTLPGGQSAPGHVLRVLRTAHWRGGVRWRARCACGWYGADETTKSRAEARAYAHGLFTLNNSERTGNDGG